MSFNYAAKTVTSFVQSVKNLLTNYFILKEDGFYLLLEDGGKIILESSEGSYQFQSKDIS